MIKKFLKGFFPGEDYDFVRGHKFKTDGKRYMFTWLAEFFLHMNIMLSIALTPEEKNLKYPDLEKEKRIETQAREITNKWLNH